jgi:hypothetical protein
VVKQDPVPLNRAKLETVPDTIRLDPKAPRMSRSALAAAAPRRKTTPERDLSTPDVQAQILPAQPEVAITTRAMETIHPRTQPLQESTPKKEISPAESRPELQPLSWKRQQPPPELEPLPPLEQKRVHQSLMGKADPRKLKSRALAMGRYGHDTPRTYHGLALNRRKVIFCLDASSSMEWNNRFVDARQELLRLLDTLDESVEFNIIVFSGKVRIWSRDGVQKGTPDNIQSAKRFVTKARIGQDGTNTASALSTALADRAVESIYFLSDGEPTVGHPVDPDEILDLVLRKKRDRNITIHTIAYVKGEPPPRWRNQTKPKRELIRLMRRLAEQNNGNYVVFE